MLSRHHRLQMDFCFYYDTVMAVKEEEVEALFEWGEAREQDERDDQ